MLKNTVELGFQAVKDLWVNLVFERHGEKDRFKGRRLGFETQCFVQKWRNAIWLRQSSLHGTARLGISWSMP